MAKIEAVTVSVGYADILEHTLPENIPYLERLVVVTHPDDKATQAVCRKYSVECVQSHIMHDEKDDFNKGKAIQVGLGHLKGIGWILHLDADVVLPHRFRDLFYRARPERHKLYGADRQNVYGWDKWCDHKHKRIPSHSQRYFIEPVKEWPMGARIIHEIYGYCPIGYFQLWHHSMGRSYPTHQGNAEHTDVLFAIQWERKDRVLLPEVIVAHLESNTGPIKMGTNWRGRKTPPFGPGHKPAPCELPKPPYCPEEKGLKW